MLHACRRLAFAFSLLCLTGFPAGGQARSTTEPTVEEILRDHVEQVRPSAFIVLRDGKRIASHGDERRKVDVASVRKSLLGALYGIAVAEGRIDPAKTLGALGIDDIPPALTDTEKRATVLDLLKARSGVYHLSAHETASIRAKRPERGSHAPGTSWFYNNWDFNVLGTLYRREVGDIFGDFERLIARPLGMEDFSARDGRYVRQPVSRHEAYPFRLSARDAARFGQMMLDGGVWAGRRIVPAEWVSASLTAYSATDRGSIGYGYLWWVLKPDVFGPGAGFAAGYGGQFIAIVPSRRLVAVQMIDERPARKGATGRFVAMLRRLVEAP